MKFIFMEPELQEIDGKTRQPASYLRKNFQVKENLEKAVVYMTALGMYIPYVNGKKISDRLLLPGFTSYQRRVQYQEFDITKHLSYGTNTIGCLLGDGWYRGNVGAFNKKNVFGKKIKFACRIVLYYRDEQVVLEGIDGWECTQEGPLRENDLKINEVYDATREMEGWCEASFKPSSTWHKCRKGEYVGEVVQDEGEEVLEQETFSPKVLTTPDGSAILDFGQNLAGHVRFTVAGDAGTMVSLTMGEALDESGNFTLKNLQGEGNSVKLMGVGQKLIYHLKEGKQTYSSFFLISGFQYVKLENWPEKVLPENFTAIAVYSNLKKTGEFSCSNEKINQLMHNVEWSMKSNFVDIPTDCPQRERAGWAGDINVFLETADYLYDTRKFISKWLKDFSAAQLPDGRLPYIIPEVPAIGSSDSSAGWADAIATVPLQQYFCYGEKEDLEVCYDTLKNYVEYNRKRAKKSHPFNLLKRGVHRKYILDTGYHYGEWLEPDGSNIKDAIKAMIYPDSEVATAWFFYSTKILSEVAGILKRTEDEKKYQILAEQIRKAYEKEFLGEALFKTKRQCKYVRPIYMGLADKNKAKELAGKLNELCIEQNYHIGTGFLTTYKILQVLTDYGYESTAYHILENEECPGWLYEVNMGATTVWEGWKAVSEKELKPLSLNHYSPGAAMSWLFSHCAGIRPVEPGYRRVHIQPVPGGTITWAKAAYESVCGRITSEWSIQKERLCLNIEIPEGIDATVILPDGSSYEHAKSGKYTCEWRTIN